MSPAPAGVLLTAARLMSGGDERDTADAMGLLQTHTASPAAAAVEMFVLLHSVVGGYYGGEFYLVREHDDGCSDAVIALSNAAREKDPDAVIAAVKDERLHTRCALRAAAESLSLVLTGDEVRSVTLTIPDHPPEDL